MSCRDGPSRAPPGDDRALLFDAVLWRLQRVAGATADDTAALRECAQLLRRWRPQAQPALAAGAAAGAGGCGCGADADEDEGAGASGAGGVAA